MDGKRNRKNVFGMVILLIMTVLMVGTVIAYAAGERSSSYYLTIEKVFADEISEEAKAEAAKKTYNFRVEAQVKSGNGYTSEVKTVSITGAGKANVDFGNAFKISVIEQSDVGEFKIDGQDWGVTKTDCVSSMHVSASSAAVNINRDGGYIEVSRPADVPTVTFKLTGKPIHEEKEGEFNNNFTEQIVTVAAGETKTLGANLPQGQYTITKLRAADGFSVLVGSREFDVAAGESGKFHINGTDSQVKIKAPDLENDVVLTHHYSVTGYDSQNKRVERYIDVKSGTTGILEHLNEGTYTIQVSETYAGIKEYSVTVPTLTLLKGEPKTGYSGIVDGTALTYDTKRTYRGLALKSDTDYVEFYGYGPLYDESGEVMTGKVTYMPYCGIKNSEGKISITTKGNESSRNAGEKYTLNTPTKIAVPDHDQNLWVSISRVSNSNVKKVRVWWREYTVKKEPESFKNPSAEGEEVVVDLPRYFILSKPEDNSERGAHVKYYYTITDSNGNPIKGFTVTDLANTPITDLTDQEGTTVMLQAGESVKISGLKAGATYIIKQEVEEPEPKGFHVKLEDTKKSATAPGGSVSIETLDARTVEISRPGKPEDDNERIYTYEITKVGDSEFAREIQLKSGEKTTVAEATGSMLPAGKYNIRATDDQIVGFDVKFSDSSSLTSDYIREATVTFTNHFNAIEKSYHVIHEYYLKNKDGSYTFEGASPVYTKNCDGVTHDDTGGHVSKDEEQLEVFGGNVYTHISDGGDAYGKVVSWLKGGEPKPVETTEEDIVTTRFGEGTGNHWTGSNGSGTEKDPGTRDYAYVPLDNMHHVMATEHDEHGSHDHGAQIIILRYEREETVREQGKYNVIHVYYQRTSSGDKWEGNDGPEQINIGHLTAANRYTTYDSGDVTQKLHFRPGGEGTQEYPYTYDGDAYGRLVQSTNENDYTGEGVAGKGIEYRKDDTMSSVKATPEGDQIIILRYIRSGGYNVVHEYYYQEKAEQVEDSGSPEENPGEDQEGEAVLESQEELFQSRAGENSESDSFNGTLSDAGGYSYDFEGMSEVSRYSDALESRHDAGEVKKEVQFKPDDEQFTYTYKDAVYGYLNKEDGTYRVAPYKTGATATAEDDEIIILRYYRGASTEGPAPDNDDDDDGGSDKPPVSTTPTPPPTATPTPSPTPTPTPTPTVMPTPEPTAPVESPLPPVESPTVPPEYPTELPPANDPESPEKVTIWENGVPKTYMKVWDEELEEYVYMLEEEVPTTNLRVPDTGDRDTLLFWAMLTALSLGGLCWLGTHPPYRGRRLIR